MAISNILVELVNEERVPVNRLSALDRFTSITGVLCSHGSNGSEAIPIRPWWDWEAYHINGGTSEWQRKPGHGAMELTVGADDPNNPANSIEASGVPALADETRRFPDNCDRVDLAFALGRQVALLCAGGNHHTVKGKYSLLWEGRELDYATAFCDGARSVNLEIAHDGQYFHRADLENAATMRVYEKRLLGLSEVVKIPY